MKKVEAWIEDDEFFQIAATVAEEKPHEIVNRIDVDKLLEAVSSAAMIDALVARGYFKSEVANV